MPRAVASTPHVGSPSPTSLQHRLAPDEAIAVAALEAEEVRAAVVPVDRRPEEEDLRERVLGRGRRGLADRAHAPRPVLGAVDPIDRDRPSRRRTMRPDHVPHCVSRVESITVFVPAVIVWRGSSSATVRAVNVTSASMPRSAASHAHPRDAQRLDDVDRQRPDARLRRDPAGMRPDANTERCTPSCTTANAPSMMPRFGYTAMPAAK